MNNLNQDNNIDFENETFEKMQERILKAGGLFYQYRPCPKDIKGIYIIENIKNGVVFAQSPLNMNDPFDSQIGFSVEALYKNSIDILIRGLKLDDSVKQVLQILLYNKMLGNFAQIIDYLIKTKQYIISRRKIMHQTYVDLKTFINNNYSILFKNYPKELKTVFNEKIFGFICKIAIEIDDKAVNEETIIKIIDSNGVFQNYIDEITRLREEKYEPFLLDFLSKLTVSCFSVSGWNNTLMWAHYADSYSGVCIEYDLSNLKEFPSLIYPIEYVEKRPSILLEDIGIISVDFDNPDQRIKKGKVNTDRLLNMLLTKHTDWKYEKEWRIINFEDKPYATRFIKLPYIKSITIGKNIDPICKGMIIDYCNANEIPCYVIKASKEGYKLERDIIDYNSTIESLFSTKYILYFLSEALKSFHGIVSSSKVLGIDYEAQTFNAQLLLAFLLSATETMVSTYFIKNCAKLVFKRELKTKEEQLEANEIKKAIKEIGELVDLLLALFKNIKFFLSNVDKTNNEYDVNDIVKRIDCLLELIEYIKKI